MTKILLLYFFPIVRKTIGIIDGLHIFLRLKATFYLVLTTCEVSSSYDNKLSRYLFSKIPSQCSRPTKEHWQFLVHIQLFRYPWLNKHCSWAKLPRELQQKSFRIYVGISEKSSSILIIYI